MNALYRHLNVELGILPVMWNDFLAFYGPIIFAMLAVVGLAFGVCWIFGLIGKLVARLTNQPEKEAAARVA